MPSLASVLSITRQRGHMIGWGQDEVGVGGESLNLSEFSLVMGTLRSNDSAIFSTNFVCCSVLFSAMNSRFLVSSRGVLELETRPSFFFSSHKQV